MHGFDIVLKSPIVREYIDRRIEFLMYERKGQGRGACNACGVSSRRGRGNDFARLCGNGRVSEKKKQNVPSVFDFHSDKEKNQEDTDGVSKNKSKTFRKRNRKNQSTIWLGDRLLPISTRHYR